jgi:general secretion pathway protein G
MQIHKGRPEKKSESGFTLLELIVVITIIGILAAIAMPKMKDVPRRAAEAALKTDLHTMRDAIDQHYGDKGRYPASLQALVDGGYLRAIPIDPITKRSDTWQVDYEEIDPDNPPPESDSEDGQQGIIDVHSGSRSMSLNGQPYAEW